MSRGHISCRSLCVLYVICHAGGRDGVAVGVGWVGRGACADLRSAALTSSKFILSHTPTSLFILSCSGLDGVFFVLFFFA